MGNLGAYQDIVVDAHKSGGVDIWLNTIKNASYQSGASDMKHKLIAPLLLAGVGLGTACTIATQKIVKWLSESREKKLLSEKEALNAEIFLKQELSDAIEEIEKEGNYCGKE